jgi:hypothetical protein
MAKQVVTRRQKDMARLIRDKKRVQKDIATIRKKK